MKKKIKKAFTLVELLVVIAILAILATVSIVGYNSFTKKARVSNDTALVAQLNTVLKADSMVNGNAKTPTDALKITEDAGYDVEKLTPTAANYQIIWNQEVNQFALLDESDNVVYGEKNTDEYKNWKFVSTFVLTDYSLYLKGNSINADLTSLKAGVDVGNNTGINTIKYTGQSTAQNVIIRTNGGTLNVDNVNDTINHYGNVNGVEIISVGQYNEYGSVNKNSLSITTKGNVSIKDGAFVNSVNVPTTSNDSIKVDLSKNSVVRSIKGDASFIKSNPNNIVFVTEDDKTEATQKISNCINDIGKIINKAPEGKYDEESYLTALKTAGISVEIDLYYTTDYTPASAVSSLEIDGVSYDFNDTQRYSMGNNAILNCKVFKINEGKLCINKITFFSALSRKQVIKVNGNQISIKEDCYDIDENKHLEMEAPKFYNERAGQDDGYVTPISANEYNVYFYEGKTTGRVCFKVQGLEDGYPAILYKNDNGMVSYSIDSYNNNGVKDDFGTYPMQHDAERKIGETKSCESTYFVFNKNGEYLGSVNIILHCFVVAR